MSGGPLNQPSGSRPTNQPWVALETGFMITRLHQPLGDASRHRGHLAVARILRPGPEEAPETVLPAPGHDVHMQVRDALAHDVVFGLEAPLGFIRRPVSGLPP